MGETQHQRNRLVFVLLLLYVPALTLFLTLPASGTGPLQVAMRMSELTEGSSPLQAVLAFGVQALLLVPVGLVAPTALGTDRPRVRALTVLATFIASALIEVAQIWIPGRAASAAQVVAHILGVLAGILLLAFLDQWRLNSDERAGAHIARRVQAEWDYFRYVYRDETSMVWALAGLALTFLVLPEPVAGVILGITLVITVWMLLREIVGVHRKWSKARFLPRDVSLASGESRFSGVPSEAIAQTDASRAVAWNAPAAQIAPVSICGPSTQTEVWFDDHVDEELRRQSLISMGGEGTGATPAAAFLATSSYQLPGPLASVSAAALRLDRSSQHPRNPSKTRLPIRFNGKLLRLATEPSKRMLTAGTFQFEQVRYFDGEASNEMWRYRRTAGSATPSHSDNESPVRQFVLDRVGRMLRLENSEAANIVGISVIALTLDNHFIFVRQSLGNSIAPKALASSGSGSLELADFHPALAAEPHSILPGRVSSTSRRKRKAEISDRVEIPMVRLLLHGMLREMAEESGISSDDIVTSSARVTGYFRWVERAMKPEFVGLVRLNAIASETAFGPRQAGERAFTQHTVKLPVARLLDLVRTGGSDYETIAALLQKELIEQLGTIEAGATGTPEQLSQMSPSCEHACVIALRFLATREGEEWRRQSEAAATSAQDA